MLGSRQTPGICVELLRSDDGLLSRKLTRRQHVISLIAVIVPGLPTIRLIDGIVDELKHGDVRATNTLSDHVNLS